MGSFNDWLFGSEDKLKKVPNKTKEQDQLNNNILQQAMGMSGSGGGYDLAQQYYNNFLGPNQQDAFNQFSAPYMQQFMEQILPQIAERFAGGGALSSSGFGQAIGGAGAGLQAQLAQLFSDLQQKAAGQQYNQYNQLSQTGLNYDPYNYVKQQGSQGFLGNFTNALAQGVGSPLGNSAAQGIMGGINSLFKNSSGGIK